MLRARAVELVLRVLGERRVLRTTSLRRVCAFQVRVLIILASCGVVVGLGRDACVVLLL